MPSQLTWLITGCSSGFGEQFVREALGRGDRVIATARGDVSRLEALKTLGAMTATLDVTASQAEVTATVDRLVTEAGRVDVLVNNAGYVGAGMIEEAADELFSHQFETNVLGTLRVSRALLPHLRNQGSGWLVFLGSPSGWQGLPGAGPYTASKFALEGIYECLCGEVAPFGVRSIIFDLGHFRTPVLGAGRLKNAPTAIPAYAPMNQYVSSLLGGLHLHQPGDPAIATRIMVDTVRGEGVAAGRTAPPRLPLGKDLLEVLRTKCRDTLAICDEWEAVASSTDFAPAVSK